MGWTDSVSIETKSITGCTYGVVLLVYICWTMGFWVMQTGERGRAKAGRGLLLNALPLIAFYSRRILDVAYTRHPMDIVRAPSPTHTGHFDPRHNARDYSKQGRTCVWLA